MEEVPPDAAPGPEAPVEAGMEAAAPVAAPAPAGAMFQTFVQSPPTRKKSVTVRRARDQPKPKKQVLVARRPHLGEPLDRNRMSNVASPQRLRGVRRLPRNAGVIARTVLGHADRFVEHEATVEYDQSRAPTPASSMHQAPVVRASFATTADLTTDESYVEALQARAQEERFEDDRSSVFVPDDASGKEGRALKRWRDQQKDWKTLTANFAKKNNKRPEDVLMLKSCEDYREQSEHYQILQASVPENEKAGEAYWEMNLRGNGQRLVRIGNLFSGLYCPLQKGVPAPAMIRRPKLPGSQGSLTMKLEPDQGWRTDPYMLTRRKQWEKGLKTLQPHCVGSGADATQIAVVGRDLFRWAATTSSQVLEQRITPIEESPRGIEEEPIVETPKERPRLEVVGDAMMHLGATNDGKPGQNSVELKNTGKTVLFYEWRINEKGPERAPDDELAVEKGMKYSDGTPMDDKVFATNRDVTFSCMTPSGSILPGCSQMARFTFKSKVPGCFVEEWQLKIRPKADVVGLLPMNNIKNNKKRKGQGIHLRGYAEPPPDKPHMRDAVDAILEKHVGPDLVKEILDDLIWEIGPSIEGALRLRNEANRSTLERTGTFRGLVFTPERWAAFELLREDARAAKREIEYVEDEEVVPRTRLEAALAGADYVPAPAPSAEAPPPPPEDWSQEAWRIKNEANPDWHPECLGLPDWAPPLPPVDIEWGLGKARERHRRAKEAAKPDPDAWDGDVDALFSVIESIAIPPSPEGEALTVATREKGSDDDSEEASEPEEEDEEDEEDDTLATGAPPKRPAPPADPRERRILALKARFTSLLASCATAADEDAAIESLKPHLAGVLDQAGGALATCEAVAALEGAKPPTALGEDPAALDAALVAGGEAVAAFDAREPPKVWDSTQMRYVAGPKITGDLAREAGLEDYGAACVVGEGPEAYRAAACATVKRLLADAACPPVTEDAGDAPPDDATADDATAATFPAPPVRRTNAVHDAIAEREKRVASLASVRPEDVAGQVVVLQVDLDVGSLLTFDGREWTMEIEDDEGPAPFQRVAKTLETLKAAKAVLLVTELTNPSSDNPQPSTKVLVEPLILAAGPDWAPRFVGDVVRAQTVLEKLAEEDAVPLLVLEARNAGPALCKVLDREIVIDEDAQVLPYWADADDAEAAEAAQNAFNENDAGYRLTALADVLVQDSLNELMPTVPSVERMHAADARSLQLCALPRSLGLNAHLETVTLARLLSGPRPIVAVVGDDRVQGSGFLRQARLVDFLLDHADEVLLSGTCARECLAALNVDVGAGGLDEAVFPVARRLLAKAVRRKVHLRLPCDYATGDIDVNEKGMLKVEEDSEDEEDDEEEDDDDDDEGDAGGFDYGGDVSDAALEGSGAKNGVPRELFALDIGARTSEAFQASLNRANTIFWSGAVGAVECSAFQQGTRDIAGACAAAIEERQALVVIAGKTATTWAQRFALEPEEFGDSGVCLADSDGRNAFAHVLCGGPSPSASGGFAPCLDAIPRREPTDDERLLPAELAQRQREAAEAAEDASGDEEEDDDEEGDY